MDLNLGQKLELTDPSLSLIVTTRQELLRQNFSGEVTFETALSIVDDLVFAKTSRHLSEAEITLLKGAWSNCEYENIAENSPYSINYLQRNLAPQLWDLLSATIGNGERLNKKKLRDFLEKVVRNKYDTQSIALNAEQAPSANNFIQVRGQPPDISSFYGRTQELTHLKELIVKQRCVSLIGAPGIGKSALAAKLLAELTVGDQPQFDCLIWKSVAHAPLISDLVVDLIELIDPFEPSSCLPEYTQAMIAMLLKQLQSRRCLLVLDEIEALFQRNSFEHRLEYKIFFRRLVEELHQSCLLLTSRVFPNDFDNLIKAKRPITYLKIKGLDGDAAMQFLADQGLTNQEKCNELIKTYYGNPSELQTVVERINHFFAGSTEMFFKNKTTFISSEFQKMLNEIFGQALNEVQRQIMIYLAEQVASNSKSITFVKLLNDFTQKQTVCVSTSELVEALENLERQSLIESIKDPITKEISFHLQPVIKKYITTDPLGLVHTSDTSSKLAMPTAASYAS